MPRQTLNIRNFHTGLMSNPDAQDISLDACTDMDSVALDGQGRLIGLPTAGSDTGAGDSMQYPYAWVKKLDNTYTLLYRNGSNIYKISDFYDATPSASSHISVTSYSMVSRGQGVHIGTGNSAPRWAGYLDHGQFGASASTGLRSTVAECLPYNGTGAGEFAINKGTLAGSTGVYIVGYRYNWAYSLIYDNIQESPLVDSSIHEQITKLTEGMYVPLIITAYEVASTNPRITGINLYRAESQTGSVNEYGFYKLVTTIDINDPGWFTHEGNAAYPYIDYGKPTGASYEDNSGIPETTTTTIVKYAFSTEVNDHLFVGKCYVDDLPDAGHMIFRSKEFRYDTFDWANEYIKLPRVPTGMRGYNGRLVVWDSSTMYVINPDRFYIMDVLDGAGCSAHKSAKVTPYGLFFANGQSAYKYDGSQVKRISDPIKDLWQAETLTPEVNYDEKENLVLFHFEGKCYYYHVEYGTWGYASSFHSGFTGGFQGKDGETYSASSSVVAENFGGASTRAWDWTSKEIDFDTWQDKKFYYLTVDGTATATWGVDGASASNSIINTTEIRSDWETTGTTWQRGKSIKIKLDATAGNSVDRLELIARTLRPVTDTR